MSLEEGHGALLFEDLSAGLEDAEPLAAVLLVLWILCLEKDLDSI